ncbi:Centrosomal protein of 97 kDa [Galdieria sulphuraria]|nr:Centrosomal protein of 97 kDa [Galdieria sulphuraria]
MSKGNLKNKATHIVFEEEEEEGGGGVEQLSGKKLTSVEIATLCPSKTKLIAKGLHISRIDNLKFFSSLRGVDVSNNFLQDLSFLKDNVDVVWLNLSHNQLTQLNNLEKLKNLEVLNVSHNQLRNLTGIEQCQELRALVANDNKIAVLDSFIKLVNLNSLILSRNCLQDVSPVRSVVTLKKLSCSHNQLRRIPDLSRLLQLTELRLNNNLIDSLSSTLASNRNLKVLDLGHNRIRNREDLSVLRLLPCLKVLNLVGNPVALEEDFQQSIIQFCPQLEQLNGKALVVNKKKRKHAFINHSEFPGNSISNDKQSLWVDEQLRSKKPTSQDVSLSKSNEAENINIAFKADSGCVAVEVKKPVSIQVNNSQRSHAEQQKVPRIEEILTFGNGDYNKWI